MICINFRYCLNCLLNLIVPQPVEKVDHRICHNNWTLYLFRISSIKKAWIYLLERPGGWLDSRVVLVQDFVVQKLKHPPNLEFQNSQPTFLLVLHHHIYNLYHQ